MRKRRNWLRTSIAMLTLIATVLETGFTSVSTLAAEITTEDGIVVNNDAIEESDGNVETSNDEELTINVEPDNDPAEEVKEEDADPEESDQAEESNITEESYSDGSEVSEDADASGYSEDGDVAEEETFEEAEELKEGTLDVSDDGISGSGYDEISIYVNTEKLSYRRSFRLEFFGPNDAKYNTVINDNLFKTDDGRYDFETLCFFPQCWWLPLCRASSS